MGRAEGPAGTHTIRDLPAVRLRLGWADATAHQDHTGLPTLHKDGLRTFA